MKGVMTALAHGVGARSDLPIPLFYAFAAALAALFVSFLGLAVLWTRPRFRGDAAGRPVPTLARMDSRGVRTAVRALGMLAAVVTVAWLLLGADDPERNPAPSLIYVLFWVGLVPASLLFGPVWRLCNPLRTVVSLIGPREPRPMPQWLGYWPAALGLLAFTWMELVSPEPAGRAVLLAFLGAYALVHLTGGLVYGLRWFDRCDAFEVYSALIGRLAFVGRRSDGRLVTRSPFNGLDGLEGGPGLVVTVGVLLGSTAYDGLTGWPAWVNALQSSPLGPTVTGTVGLLAAVALVIGLYVLCAARGAFAQGAFAHSLIPIAVGYLIAHYFSLLMIEGQRGIILTLGLPASVNEGIVSPGVIAVVQVLAIVAGHVLGVIAAHDRSVRLLPPERAVSGQIPMFLLMVVYTFGGLTLLLA